MWNEIEIEIEIERNLCSIDSNVVLWVCSSQCREDEQQTLQLLWLTNPAQITNNSHIWRIIDKKKWKKR